MSDKGHKRSENSPSREQDDSGQKQESQVFENEDRAQEDSGNETGNVDLGFETQGGGVDSGPGLNVHLPIMGFAVESIHESLLPPNDDDGNLMVTGLAMSDENPDLGDQIHVDHGDLPIQETEEGRILSLQSAEFGVNDQIMVYDPGAHLALVTTIDATSANAEL